jgi:hypothetical protein
MQLHINKMFVKLSLRIIGILLFVSPCYPKNGPDPSPTEEVLAIQRLLQDALQSADEVILYSLDPEEIPHVRPGETPFPPGYLAKLFNRWRILGQAQIEDPSERRRLVDSLCQGVADHPSTIELCFCPRNGLRFLRKRSQILDVTICFQCHQIQLNGNSPFYPISSSPLAVFDSAVQKAYLPVSTKKTLCD